MRVMLAARMLQERQRTGIHRYIDCLATALPAALATGDELMLAGYVANLDDGPCHDPKQDAITIRQGGTYRPRSAARRIAWEQTALPALAMRQRVDLIHAPANVVPLFAPTRLAVTVHDLAFLTHPETVPRGRRRYLTAMMAASIRRASVVLAVSESTRNDILHHFGTDPDRVLVTPLATAPHILPIEPNAIARFRADHEITRPYVLAVGTQEPRKNLPVLIAAFAHIAPDIPHDLVLLGAGGWLTHDFEHSLAILPIAVHSRIRRLGYVPELDLSGWYAGADLFVFPSLSEGFGLPILEAMTVGTPVITSNTSSLSEIAGDAAILIDPRDIDGLALAMGNVLHDPPLAERLRVAGRVRARQFSWEATASLTVAAYRQALR